MRYLRVLLPVLVLVPLAGCPHSFNDSWRHYHSGGSYITDSPCMSPDGTTIVFSSPRTGHGDIYQIDRDGSNPVRLTDSPQFESTPVYSPDGETIAFVREINGACHVWLMEKNGSNQRQITTGGGIDEHPRFSHDGSELIVSRSPASFGAGRTSSEVSIKLADASVQALDGTSIQYSPDGKCIAYQRYDAETKELSVWLRDADGSNDRRLSAGFDPRFSPDGRTVLYNTENKHPGSLWKMIDVDGSNERDLAVMMGPMFTADGKHIVGFSPEFRRQIWRMDADGANRKVLKAPTGYVDYLRPCKDGFIFRLVPGEDRVGDIYVINTSDWTVERVGSLQ